MKTVLIVDDDIDLCRAFVLLCQTIPGVSCTCALSFEQLGEELGEDEKRILAYDLIILDIHLGPGKASGIDIYNWLVKRGFQGRAVFFTGHAKNHPLVAEAFRISGTEVVEKPLGIDRIEDLILGVA
jgi:response regulator of citrate/malate metabolism